MSIDTDVWYVAGFKGIERAEVPLNGLSILAGENSAGKSSLTQTLLLIAQSPGSDVVLNGPLVRFGSATDTINENSERIELGWDTTLHERHTRRQHPPSQVSAHISLSEPKSRGAAVAAPLVVSRVEVRRGGRVIFEASNERVDTKTNESRNPGNIWGDSLLRVRSINEQPAPGRTYIAFSGLYPRYALYKATPKTFASRVLKYYSQLTGETSDRRNRMLIQGTLLNLLELIKPAQSPESRDERDDLHSRVFQEFDHIEDDQQDLNALIYDIAASATRDGYAALRLDDGMMHPLRYGRAIEGGFVIPENHVESWFSLVKSFENLEIISRRVRYIGPLREEPQVLSTTGGRNDTAPAGLRGEYTADLLFRSKDSPVDFVDPDGANVRLNLQEAVGLWSAWLGVGDEVNVTDQGKLGRGIVVTVNGRERDLTTIGVGVSQLLPVITVVLSSPRHSILILEQPELHLHPAIQSRLANFFAFARPDLSIIVETHSEYLITKLRRLNVEGKLSDDKICFLFAAPGDSGTRISRLQIGDLGDIVEWPHGFFDTQEIEERKLLIALAKRSRRDQ